MCLSLSCSELVDIVISVLDRLPLVRPPDDAAGDPAFISRMNLARLVGSGAGPSPTPTPVPVPLPQQSQQHQQQYKQYQQQQQQQFGLRQVSSETNLFADGAGPSVKSEPPRQQLEAAPERKAAVEQQSLPPAAAQIVSPAPVPLTADLVVPPMTAAELDAQRRCAVQRVLESAEGECCGPQFWPHRIDV